MTPWKHFFIFCSGIESSVLEKTPTDTNKYIGIGATVLFTGLLAMLSSAYAFYTIFDSWISAIFFGMIWGLMIFNLDRYIVSSMKRQGSFFKDIFTALPRFVMAILLAMVISVPLELKIFDKEIQSELVLMEQEVLKNQESALFSRFEDQKVALNAEQANILSSISEKSVTRDQLLAEATAEADGTGGSMQRNAGPIYKIKKQNADQAQIELDILIAQSEPKLSAINTKLENLDTQVETELSGLNRTSLGGVAFRIEALDRLASRSEAIWFATLFITLLFIAIETAPLFVKLISSRSPYDYVLHEIEHQFKMKHALEVGLVEKLSLSEVKYEIRTDAHKTAARIKAENKLIDIAIAQRVEELKKQPISWKRLFNKKSILDEPHA